MKIYTKTGDDGTTSLFDGTRVPKNDLRVSAYGAVDELNAMLGIALSDKMDADLRDLLRAIQRALFALGAQLANPAKKKQKEKADFPGKKVEVLEQAIDRLEGELEPLKTFILPGGSPFSARLHYARTVCRRAEREVVTLSKKETVAPILIVYLNRLSDLLFVIARAANRRANVPDIPWEN